MKTFKQFNEELPKPVTPKQLDVFKSDFRFKTVESRVNQSRSVYYAKRYFL